MNDRKYVFHFRPKPNIWPEKHLALGWILKLKPKVHIFANPLNCELQIIINWIILSFASRLDYVCHRFFKIQVNTWDIWFAFVFIQSCFNLTYQNVYNSFQFNSPFRKNLKFDFRPYSAFKFGGRNWRPKAENFRFRLKISASGIPLQKRAPSNFC